MQASEIREMTESDIQARITELQEERFRLRFRGATEQLEEPLRLRAIRRDVARLKTEHRLQPRHAAAPAGDSPRRCAAEDGAPSARDGRGRDRALRQHEEGGEGAGEEADGQEGRVRGKVRI